MEEVKKLDKRAFTSIGLLIASVIMPVSILLRHTLSFGDSGESVRLFTGIHSSTGVVFVFFFLAHLILNWKAVRKYLSGERRPRKEVLVSICFVALFIALFSTLEYFAD